jgi:hypothetical protein
MTRRRVAYDHSIAWFVRANAKPASSTREDDADGLDRRSVSDG